MLHLPRTGADIGPDPTGTPLLAAFAALPIATLAVDAAGRIVFANAAFVALGGQVTGTAVTAVVDGLALPLGTGVRAAMLARPGDCPILVEATVWPITQGPEPLTGLALRPLTDASGHEAIVADMARQAADALAEARAAEIRLRDIVETLPQAVCVFDDKDRYVLWNDAYAALYPEIAGHLRPGAAFIDILKVSIASGLAPEQIDDSESWLTERMRKHALPASQEEQEMRDGRWVRHDDRRTKDGGAIGMRIDITDLKQREASFRLLFDSNPVPMLLVETPSLAISAANDAALAFYGRSRADLMATTLDELHIAAERSLINDRLARLAEPCAGKQVWRQIGAVSAERDVLLFSCALPDDGRGLQLIAVVDVTERTQAEARILHLAHHDPLTGLANRTRFGEALEAALAAYRHGGAPLVLHYLDLDNFKPVNDSLGHSGGDRLLEQVAERLRAITAPEDLAARLGGDEFVLLQRDLARSPADVATRIITDLGEPFLVNGASVRTGASVGVATVPPCAADGDTLLKEADAALYEAKAAGGGRWRMRDAGGGASRTTANRRIVRPLPATGVAAFVTAATDPVICADSAGRITLFNAAAEALFGLPAERAIGASLDIIMPEPMRGAHAAGIDRMRRGAPTRIVGTVVEVVGLNAATGRTFPIEMSLTMWQEGDEPAFGAVIRNGSERRRNEERLHQLAHFDQLTMLPNRTLLFERMSSVLDAGRAGDLCLIDIDGLKDVNDLHGPDIGDELLRSVAVRLRQVAAALSDDPALTVARIGCDEFAIFVPRSPGDDIDDAFGETARAMLAIPVDVGGVPIGSPASAGLVRAPEHGTTPAELIANVDLALNRAKFAGGGRSFVFDLALRRHNDERRALKREFERALADSEFEVFYQPQVSLPDGRIRSAEALLRWRHPERGLLSPAAFIDALEASPHAGAAGAFVLREACRQAVAWRRLVPDFTIAVNLFEAQLGTAGIVEAITATLTEVGLEPAGLEIEITEKVALVDDPALAARVGALRDLGIGIAFDDYGTGYASLSLLKQFPLTRLKIDRRFVGQVGADGSDTAIVAAILSLGRKFDLEVIAEGVETAEQAAHLAAAGCHFAQGYLFGKPMPAAAFTAQLAAQPGAGA
ncbi:diguanylate cyclase domain-containing protein [Methylobrevis albus]|uniref:Diguanylate cyclase n=1 Tax=Methylobrevis albus TaxID=2793297 RepID=A0A931I3W0_9HYPH|nr:diguanylate cyclase [Methylobrevis albus]MBH0238818.1 diguanylate cyclase [Methylobrevis albus]